MAGQPIAGGFDARSELIAQQAREDERRRIARDLHDDISQQFALLTIALDLLRQHPAASHPDMRRRLDEILARAQAIGSSVRGVSHQLHGPRLGDLGAAVRGLCQEAGEHYGIDVRVLCDLIPSSVSGVLGQALFRIVQQALLNIVTHSGARHAAVEIAGRSGSVLLTIMDDGRGFDVAAPENRGMGLASMRERLEPFGGLLSIRSAPAHGTCIQISVPLWRADTAAA
jgi:signal transduction histidine kinase